MLSISALARLWRAASVLKDWQSRHFLAVDLELTGLSPGHDSILSLGWVAFDSQTISLASATEIIVNGEHRLGQSPTIHGLTHRDLAQGMSLCDALKELHANTDSDDKPVWVFHNAALDWQFLCQAWRECQLPVPDAMIVDTLLTEQRKLNSQSRDAAVEGLSLEACRQRYGLGAFPAHSALEDALATAELMLHQCRHQCEGPVLYSPS